MSGLVLEINGREFTRRVGEIADTLANPQRGLEAAGAVGAESVRTNFRVGGRPTPWPAPKNRDGQPLRDTGRLQNSIGYEVRGDAVYIGTNVEYAAVHHFGAARGSFGQVVVPVASHQRTRGGKPYQVRAHSRRVALPWGDIPAREFLLLQEEDVTTITGLLLDQIMEEHDR